MDGCPVGFCLRGKMNLTEKENELFERWESQCRKHGENRFVKDGAADLDRFEKAPLKLVFVLKEAYADESFDLREYLREPNLYPTMVRWIEGILALPDLKPWSELDGSLSKVRRDQAVRQIVFMNVKKKGGGPSANWKEIRSAMKRDSDFIREQLAMYKPDVVILCGSDIGDGLEDLYSISDDAWARTDRGIWHCTVGGVLHVLYRHPAARDPAHMKHYGLIDALHELHVWERRR